jgi:hypothetical protein
MNLASNLPAIEGAPEWMVRGRYTWGRSATLRDAIQYANAAPGDKVHVCRCDDAARCDSIAGSLESNVRGEIWEGNITRNGADVKLVAVTHPVR